MSKTFIGCWVLYGHYGEVLEQVGHNHYLLEFHRARGISLELHSADELAAEAVILPSREGAISYCGNKFVREKNSDDKLIWAKTFLHLLKSLDLNTTDVHPRVHELREEAQAQALVDGQ